MTEDTNRLNQCERFRFQVCRSGYRGRYGWCIVVADPGGHYQEERTKEIAWGSTIREVIDAALLLPPYERIMRQGAK